MTGFNDDAVSVMSVGGSNYAELVCHFSFRYWPSERLFFCEVDIPIERKKCEKWIFVQKPVASQQSENIDPNTMGAVIEEARNLALRLTQPASIKYRCMPQYFGQKYEKINLKNKKKIYLDVKKLKQFI